MKDGNRRPWPRMEQYDLAGQRVLARVDLNVPVQDGQVTNDARIRAILPTVESVLAAGGQLLLMSHLGRPQEGLPIAGQPQFSLLPVARRLSELLERPVPLVADYMADPAQAAADTGLALLENVRVNPGEAANDEALSRAYAQLCDVFVLDAFATAHRAQASTCGVIEFAPLACAGPLLARELDALERAMAQPQRPLLAIVGGAKVSSKLAVLESLAPLADQLIVGGGIANTFLAAAGHPIGRSLHEADLLATARQIMAATTVPLPVDVVTAPELSAAAIPTVKAVAEVGADDMILDIGPQTAGQFKALIAGMKTIIWNGPVGVFEFEAFAAGTRAVAGAVAASAAFSVAGGGETVAAIETYGIRADISCISTGGGAFLEYVGGADLPSLRALRERAAASV